MNTTVNETWLWSRNMRPTGFRNDTGLICTLENKRKDYEGSNKLKFSTCEFSIHGEHLLCVDTGGVAYLIKMYSGLCELLPQKISAGSKVSMLKFSPIAPREYCAMLDDHSVVIQSVDNMNYCKRLSPHKQTLVSIDYHPSRQQLLTASRNDIVVWNTKLNTKKKTLESQSTIVQVKYSPLGDILYAGFRNGYIIGWDSITYQVRVDFRIKVPEMKIDSPHKHSCSVACFAISRDSYFIAIATGSGQIQIWELASQTLVRTTELPKGAMKCTQIEFSYDASSIYVIADDGIVRNIKVLGAAPLKTIFELQHHGKVALSFALAPPDGKMMAVCYSDGTMSIHNVDALAKSYSKEVQAANSFYEVFEKPARVSVPIKSKVSPSRMQSFIRPSAQKPNDEEKASSPPFSKNTQKSIEKSAVPRLVYLARNMADHRGILDRNHLGKMLKMDRKFPSKFRVLIWRYLLQLPENSTAYCDLVKRGKHHCLTNLATMYPMQARRVFLRFERVMNAVVHWCPMFAELAYVPAIAFPFVVAFDRDEVSAFETVVTVLNRCMSSWFDSYPHAPVFYISNMEKILREYDPVLMTHFERLDVTVADYAWPLLRSLFSEILEEDCWLQLWDHIIYYLDDIPYFFEATALAYACYHRASLLAIKEKHEAVMYFRTEHAIEMRVFIATIIKLCRQCGDAFVTQFSVIRRHRIPVGENYPPFYFGPTYALSSGIQDYAFRSRHQPSTKAGLGTTTISSIEITPGGVVDQKHKPTTRLDSIDRVTLHSAQQNKFDISELQESSRVEPLASAVQLQAANSLLHEREEQNSLHHDVRENQLTKSVSDLERAANDAESGFERFVCTESPTKKYTPKHIDEDDNVMKTLKETAAALAWEYTHLSQA